MILVYWEPIRNNWRLMDGSEFLDGSWPTREEAVEWAKENLGEDPDKNLEEMKYRRDDGLQRRLF